MTATAFPEALHSYSPLKRIGFFMQIYRFLAIFVLLSLGPIAQALLPFSAHLGLLADENVRFFLLFFAWVMTSAGLFLSFIEYQLYRDEGFNPYS